MKFWKQIKIGLMDVPLGAVHKRRTDFFSDF